MKRLLSGSVLLLALSPLTGCSDDEPPEKTAAPAGTPEAAAALAADLEERYAAVASYPADRVSIERLIEDGELAPPASGNRLHNFFRLTQQPGFLFCLVNDSSGDYAVYDSTKGHVVAEGNTDPGGETAFDVVCSPTLTD